MNCRLILAAATLLATSALAAEPIKFIDDSFADFAAGTIVDGGQNLYVARDGTLRTINRFDLNDDGHLDVIFNCTHNTYQMISATAGVISKNGKALSRPIAVEGSQKVATADLNRDGFTDLVFCPNRIGVHHDRRFVFIAWGSDRGWTKQRINSPLPMNAAADVAIADLNADGWKDIAVLGATRWLPNQPPGRIIRIYWGSSIGYSSVDVHDLGVPGAVAMTAADFDGNKSDDLAVLRSDGQVSLILATKLPGKSWIPRRKSVNLQVSGSCIAAGDINGDKRADLVIGRQQPSLIVATADANHNWSTTLVKAFPCSHITVSDLDQDNRADLVLTQFQQSRAAGGEQAGAAKEARRTVRVLWGAAGGFDKARATSLPNQSAVASAAGDMNGDGKPDLVIAVHQGQETFAGTSHVWFGTGNRTFKKGKTGFRTSGTTDVAIVPAEKKFPARAVFCNSIGGNLHEAVPLHVFWGGAKGFDPKRVWKIPFNSGYESSAADLNADGFADLIVLNSGHSGAHAHTDKYLGANILWGGPAGLEKSKKRSVIHEHFLGTSTAADLDKDGWLDLVLEPFGPERPGEKEKLYIHYGSAKGFQRKRRVVLQLDGYGQEHLVADLNRDRWLDIVVTSRSLNRVRILWGSKKGFSTSREQRIKFASPLGADAADFNRDGWLDLLIGSYNDPKSGFKDMGSIIFWGGRKGFTHSNAQWLPGFSPLGRTVADLDGDGHLDIVSPQHSGELTREDLACHIYWGSRRGFATRRRTTFFSDSVNDTMVADFNSDGRLDLAVNAHTRHGDHRTMSRIFYNDGNRFKNPKIQKLPTNGPHLMWATDVGNIYDRKYRHGFISRVFKWNSTVTGGTIQVKAKRPKGTGITIQYRSGANRKKLAGTRWSRVKKNAFSLRPTDRFVQYRIELHSDNGDRYPVVDRVELSVGEGEAPAEP